MTKRIALVTGGVGGIGSAIIEELSAKGLKTIAGFHPAEEARAFDVLKEWQAKGIDVALAKGDVSSFSSCVEMADYIKQNYGPVDVLVNCAGITRDKSLKKMVEQEWTDVINVNLNSVYNVTKQFFDGMTERGYGRIINISSVNGKKGQFGQTNYSAAKAGMHGFTMALAQEGAKKAVTVNTISPGYTATPMTKQMAPEILEQIVKEVPMARMATPQDIAYAVGILADERASYITGVNLSVNGGLYI